MKNNLDISIIELKDLFVDNPLLRIDADFFRQKYLSNENEIKGEKWNYLNNMSDSIINFGAYSLCNQIKFLDDGVPYLNVGDIKENNIDYQNAKRIDKDLSVDVLKKSLIKDNQVLLTIAGTIGTASVAYKLPPFTNSNQAIAKITLKDSVSPFYLSVYLNSKFGKSQTQKLTISSVQPNLLLTQVKQIKISLPSEDLQKKIENLYKKAHHIQEEANDLYSKAEKEFLGELKLTNFKDNDKNISVINYKECLAVKRFNAEYWQPKYKKIEKLVSKITQKDLGEIVSMKKGIETGSEAYSDLGKPFIRVSDFSIRGIGEVEKKISNELYEKLRNDYQPKNGEILFTKDGTIGISFAIHNDIEAIISGAFLRLKPKIKIDIDYLALVLNSLYCKAQSERMSGGAVIFHLKPDDVKKIKIPILSEKKQQKLSQKVLNSIRLREKAKILFNKAKRAVEIFIEKSEKEAIQYLT